MVSVKDAVIEEYKSRNVEVRPCFPNILVRVLEKEHSDGGIIFPSDKQNKPVAEAVVVAVYKPFWQTRKAVNEQWLQASLVNWQDSKYIIENEDDFHEVVRIWREAAVKPGDHIVMPHIGFGITPVWPLDGGKGSFRNVQEGQIYGVLEYQQLTTRDWLKGLVSSVDKEDFLDTLLQNADVVRKRESITLSGR